MEVSSRSAGVLPSVTAARISTSARARTRGGVDALSGQIVGVHPDRSVTVDDLRARVADVVGG